MREREEREREMREREEREIRERASGGKEIRTFLYQLLVRKRFVHFYTNSW